MKSFSKVNKYTTYNFTGVKRFRNSFSECNNGSVIPHNWIMSNWTGSCPIGLDHVQLDWIMSNSFNNGMGSTMFVSEAKLKVR